MIAVYPGTFDPVTNGHVDIIERASRLSERLVVAVLSNVAKRNLFTEEERVAHIKTAVKHLPNVEVIAFHGLQVELAETFGAAVIIRGLRSSSDYDRELSMALGNRCMNPAAETLFIPASPAYGFISSSLIREIASFGGNIKDMVPPFIQNELKEKLKDKQKDKLQREG